MRYTFALLVVACVGLTHANSCSGKANTVTPKEFNGKLVATVKNGKMYIDDSNGKTPMRLVHVWGSDYEMGHAVGELTKDFLQNFMDGVFKYLEDEVAHYLPNAPQWILDIIDKFGINGALDLTYEWTKPYTPQHFEDEIRGMADGSGLDIQTIRRMNMIPELIKAQCSMAGAWGTAISDGTLYQLRALDWQMGGPFADYAAVMIYHPDNGYKFAHLAWTGFVGALTGYSSANVGICEKVWDHYNGTYFVDGYPFHYLLRDILQFDSDISAALDRIMNAKRTCSIFVGLGDSLTNQFRAMEYSHDILNIYSDESYPVYDGHPHIDHVVYINKHVQPSKDACLGEFLTERTGKIDAATLIEAASLHQTGDNHAAVYDYKRNLMYVSSASSFTNGDPIIPAYDRPFWKIDLNKMWAEQRP